MSRIFDNIQQELLKALRATLQVSRRADFCIGYLNLRGWQAIDDLITGWDPATGQVCRVLVGMQRPPQDEIRELYRQANEDGLIDNATASRLKTQFAAHLREHALEVQLPFLRMRRADVAIAALCLGPLSVETCQAVGRAVAARWAWAWGCRRRSR